MIGLAIDQETNDVYLDTDGSLVMVNDALAVGQHVRQRLKTYRGEWFLDTTAGVPWLEQIFGRAFDAALGEAVVKGEIFDTLGVTQITTFSIRFLRDVRALDIRSVEVLTIYDQEVSA